MLRIHTSDKMHMMIANNKEVFHLGRRKVYPVILMYRDGCSKFCNQEQLCLLNKTFSFRSLA